MKNFLLLLIGLLASFVMSTPVAAAPVTTDQAFMLNRSGALWSLNQLGTAFYEAHTWAACVYDFAVQGGAISTVNCKGPNGEASVTLPKKSLIVNAFLNVITAPTSGGSATVAFGASSTTDIKGATAIASLTQGYQGSSITLGTPSTYEKLAAADKLTATIATATLTAGKIVLYVEYLQGL